MPFKPPLTREKLQEIDARNPGNADVRALLWEIKRLRALVLRFDQVQKSITPGSGAEMIVGILREELKGEPCIEEQPKLDL